MDASDLVAQLAHIIAALGSIVKGISINSQLMNGVLTPPTALHVILASYARRSAYTDKTADVDKLIGHRCA